MSIFTGKGQDVKKFIEENKKKKEENKLDFKKIKINKDLKKEGDSIRVRILSAYDYTTYEAHGLYDKGIYTAPCINPTGEGEQRCLFCEASKLEDYKKLKASTRFLFAFYDIDMEMIRYIDVSYTQGTSLMDDIEENADSIDEFAFTLKRSGEGTKTNYKLSAILGMKKKDKEAQTKFESASELKVDDNFFEQALYVKSTNQMAIDLENAGIDVEKEFGYEIQDDSKKEESEKGNEDVKPADSGDVDPTKVF